MPIIRITSLLHPGVEIFSSLTEAQLRRDMEPEKGIFIAESPKVIRVALNAGHEPLALLCEERHIMGDAADIIARYPEIPVYTGDREMLASLTGYTLTRGVLCAMRRPTAPTVEEICKDAQRIVVIDLQDGSGIVELINPEIIASEGEQVDVEGCLSVPGRRGMVKRPMIVRARFQDRHGEWYEIEADELLARCIMHETDHLDGVLYIDRL